jgi:hypothetical protein
MRYWGVALGFALIREFGYGKVHEKPGTTIAAVELHQLLMAGTAHLADFCVSTENHPSSAQAEPGPRHREESLVPQSFLDFETSPL